MIMHGMHVAGAGVFLFFAARAVNVRHYRVMVQMYRFAKEPNYLRVGREFHAKAWGRAEGRNGRG
jgi:hypothetical protein